MTSFDILIVGAGHAGAQAAALLRQMKFAGTIGLLGDEPLLPYERPPLSKEYLLGDKSFERILLRPERFWTEHAVDLLPGRRVVAVDPGARQVRLAEGSTLGYAKLIWATGGAPRMLSCPGASPDNIRTIRNRGDVDAILGRLDTIERVAIIGGGYIGLEAAAVLAKLGKQVTVLEALGRVLARVAGSEISSFIEAKHRNHGVDIRTGVGVDCIAGDGAVLLANGQRLVADLVIAGIGIVPATQPLIAAGAAGTNGVDTDEHCCTSLDHIYAIGDCAAHANRFAAGQRIRLESVQNANDQAKTAVHHIMGDPKAYDAVPWFWSNQYDVKLQTIGLSIGHDHSEIRGDPESGIFAVAYLKQGRVIALDCVNSAKAFVQGRAEVLAGVA